MAMHLKMNAGSRFMCDSGSFWSYALTCGNAKPGSGHFRPRFQAGHTTPHHALGDIERQQQESDVLCCRNSVPRILRGDSLPQHNIRCYAPRYIP